MAAAEVPTAMARVCSTLDEVADALDAMGAPHVVKDDGLAAGKGVVVTDDREAALDHARACLAKQDGRVVVEEFLDGPEVSLFCLCDGSTVIPLAPAQDFKRVGDGDAGPNTGGMGAYSPLDWAPASLVDELVSRVAQPTVDEMARRGTPFVGVLYLGLALTSRGPRVIEFNARFGDPETQVVLARLRTPLGGLLLAAARGQLDRVGALSWATNHAVTVVVAAAQLPRHAAHRRPHHGPRGGHRGPRHLRPPRRHRARHRRHAGLGGRSGAVRGGGGGEPHPGARTRLRGGRPDRARGLAPPHRHRPGRRARRAPRRLTASPRLLARAAPETGRSGPETVRGGQQVGGGRAQSPRRAAAQPTTPTAADAAITTAKSAPGRSGSCQAIAAPVAAIAAACATDAMRLDAAVMRPWSATGASARSWVDNVGDTTPMPSPATPQSTRPGDDRQHVDTRQRRPRDPDGDEGEADAQPSHRSDPSLDHVEPVQLRSRRPAQAGHREAGAGRRRSEPVDRREHERDEAARRAERRRDEPAQRHQRRYAAGEPQRPGRQHRPGRRSEDGQPGDDQCGAEDAVRPRSAQERATRGERGQAHGGERRPRVRHGAPGPTTRSRPPAPPRRSAVRGAGGGRRGR